MANLSGVAKYLKNLEASEKKAVETGVARYIKDLEASTKKSSETGVARYIKARDKVAQ